MDTTNNHIGKEVDWPEVEIDVEAEVRQALNKLESENQELRAQLARCVEVLQVERNNLIDECETLGIPIEKSKRYARVNGLLHSLQKTAALDARILRCADNQEHASTSLDLNYQDACDKTTLEVRARNKAE